MYFIYNIGIGLYHLGIRLASLFNKKAKLWRDGRKDSFELLKSIPKNHPNVIWVHCASLGEFEQARPLIDLFKNSKEETFVLLSFYSPSGFEATKGKHNADLSVYLPQDSPSNAKRWIGEGQVRKAIIIKYEFWYAYLRELNSNRIPTYLVAGIFRPNQVFFKWYGQWFIKQLKAFDHFFVQNEESVQLLHNSGFSDVSLSGDTRFDRVIENAASPFESELLSQFCLNETCIVWGSAWKQEMEILINFHNSNLKSKSIIAPHNIKEEEIQWLSKSLGNICIRWSKLKDANQLKDIQVIIIDEIGLLSKLYRFGKIAVIGGGFGAGIHNTLEAAVYEIPVLFGPNFHKFQEAKDLIQCEGALSSKSTSELEKEIKKLINNPDKRMELGREAKGYVYRHEGSSKKVFEHIIK